MPNTFSTPEAWFRTHQKDLYVLDRAKNIGRHPRDRAFDVNEDDYFDIQDALFNWFAENLPLVIIKSILPSEYSGILIGASSIVADLDEPSLITFCDAWENSDAGWMVVEKLSYDQWLARINSCKLISAPMVHHRWWFRFTRSTKSLGYFNQQQPVSWWDTTNGIMLISAAYNSKLLSSGDSWWLLEQLVPEMKNFKINDCPHGTFFPKNIGQNHQVGFNWVNEDVESWSGEEYQNNSVQMNRLRDALGIAERHVIDITIGD
jgi:hypothetical protein